MLIDFDKLPQESRIWIFQSSREILAKEVTFLQEDIKRFLNSWLGHGKAIPCAFEIRYARFVIVGADTNRVPVGGCAVDMLYRFMRAMGTQLALDLLNRTTIYYKDGQGGICHLSLDAFSEQAKKGQISQNMVVFNNLITTKAALDTKWELMACNSWHANYWRE